tara:strand:- start:5806 stop:6255 length:450 start_codon:yes stop_codon:yes gene_type:complete
MKKKRNIFPFKGPYVYVPMCIDYLHHGHINILKKAKKFGKVIVGLMTDKAILSYKKRKPIIKFSNRKKIIESLKIVDFVIPLRALNYPGEAEKYKFNYFVHGTDWRKGPQLENRNKLIKTMKKWNGKVIEIPYTRGISSSIIRKNRKKN